MQGQTPIAPPAHFPEMAAPHIVLASPAGIASTTPKSTHQASGQHHAITTGEHLSVSTGLSMLASVKEKISLFTYRMGMKLIAASKDIELEAQSDEIVLIARDDIKITSTTEDIIITSPKRVLINGGGSFMQWNAAGITQGTAGTYTEHVPTAAMEGPKSMAVTVTDFSPTHSYDEAFVVRNKKTGQPIPCKAYRIQRANGKYEYGVTDQDGRTHVVGVMKEEKLKLQIEE